MTQTNNCNKTEIIERPPHDRMHNDPPEGWSRAMLFRCAREESHEGNHFMVIVANGNDTSVILRPTK